MIFYVNDKINLALPLTSIVFVEKIQSYQESNDVVMMKNLSGGHQGLGSNLCCEHFPVEKTKGKQSFDCELLNYVKLGSRQTCPNFSVSKFMLQNTIFSWISF